MPSTFPRLFQKRKSSSGDVLEDVKDRPTSSFKVLERPAEPIKSFGDKPSRGLRKPNDASAYAANSLDDDASRPGFQNRGSAGTQRSASSYGAYNTSSSDRYSSSSTLPSATSAEGDDFSAPHPAARSSRTMPVGTGDSNPGFLRQAGRKFSFAGKKSMQAVDPDRPDSNEALTPLDRPLYSGIHDLHIDSSLPAVPPIGRARATTEASYGSEVTITPGGGVFEQLELQSGSDEDGFGDIFAGIGEEKRRSQMLASSANSGRQLTEINTYKPYRPESAVPAALQATRNYGGPSALNSATSADGLMVASPVEDKRGVFEMGINSPVDMRAAEQAVQSPTSPASPARQNGPRRQSRANSKGLLSRRQSEFFEDTDALLVNEAVARQHSPRVERAPPKYIDERAQPGIELQKASAESASNPWAAADAAPPPPPHKQVPELKIPTSPNSTADNRSPHVDGIDRGLLNDAAFQALAVSADRLQQRAPSPPRAKPTGKVMTPAQFERYRREQAQRRLADDDLSDSDDSKSDQEEEEEDDSERHRRMVKQRQRQEAQMSVFRQSMMKTTGEQPLGNLRPPMDRNSSRMSKQSSLSNLRVPPSPSEEDEDDDVPLGILAAHGFPSKEHNRPPNHERSGSAAGIQYSSETYPPPPQSIAGGAGSGGALPAFARKLPQDPFYGSSLVNQSDRQSLALGGGDRGSVYAPSQVGGSQSSSNLPPPGGLIGVIASEERARQIRRGGQAKTFGFGAQDPSGSMPLPPGVGGQPMMPMPMPMPMMQPPPQAMEQQANAQMAQQMTQMMQMQMQWMQQMMAMQAGGMQMNPQMQQMQQMMMGMNGGMPGMMPGTPGSMVNQQSNGRASTMMGPPSLHPNLGAPNQHGRAMSMMGGARAPSVMMGGMGPLPGYTPSIAPSERSNIGQPSRYRPVSTVPADNDSRGSRTQSFSAKSTLGFATGNSGRLSTMGTRPGTSGGLNDSRKSQVNIRLVETRPDEDEEAGWEEMRKKKENKKSLWRLRKGVNGNREKENISPKLSQSSADRVPSPKKSPEGLEGVFVPDVSRI